MMYLVYMGMLIIALIASKVIFKPSIKRLRALEDNKEVEELVNKFPEDLQMAGEILDMIEKEKGEENFKRPKVEQVEDTKTSLYIAVTNKILIVNMKNNYARIQTIAHECIHSAQNKGLIFFNFIISNINILFFLIAGVLTLFRVIEINMPILAVFSVTVFTQFIVRIHLEVDAMKKARVLAEEYIKSKDLELSEEDVEKILESYDEINEEGIPFIIDNYFVLAVGTLLIYLGAGLRTIIEQSFF